MKKAKLNSFELFVSRIWHALLRAAPLRTWAQIGAAMIATIVAVGYGVVIWKGPWPEGSANKQLDLLGTGQLAAWLMVLVTVVCITGTKVNFNASRNGIQADVDAENAEEEIEEIETIVTTTTTTQIDTDKNTKKGRPEGRPV
jgi:hypothetical protein